VIDQRYFGGIRAVSETSIPPLSWRSIRATMEATSLSNLPTELIFAILSKMSSPDDLLSLILTCARIYESFERAEQEVLSAVARISLDSPILADALVLPCSLSR
jgi:F-box-like